MKALRRLLWVVVLLFVAVLAAVAVNQQPVSLKFLVWQTPQWSVFWWLLVAFVAGGLLGHALALLSTIPTRIDRRRIRKSLQVAEGEVARLRTHQGQS
ncbi:MAG: DUF1049 domain-containing protein [Pseudomonadales bacterium]|nr:DUF1049 domain-containing protein [Pseudomonadales bacterium]MCP5182450.1 DUF1049 domain-containing protein [Pseudomonadales bacterium]